MRVTVVGDCTLDVIARPRGALRPGGDVPADVAVGPGGQGANVAVRLARQGVPVRLVAALADDHAGRLLAAALAEEGVELVRLPAARSGTVVALLDEGGERTMLSDRVSLDPSGLDAAIDGADWVHASGYALADAQTGDALAAALARAHPGRRVSVAGGSFSPDASSAASLRVRMTTVRPDLLILDRQESQVVLGGVVRSLAGGASSLAAAMPGTVAVVTGGAEGSAAAGLAGTVAMTPEAPPPVAVDATGAGDAYAASLIATFLGAPWPPGSPTLHEAMERAGEVGAQVSQVMGAQGHVPAERGLST